MALALHEVILRVCASTDPAPLELAYVACHVVAARFLLNLGLTFGTERNVDASSLKDLRIQLLSVRFTTLPKMFGLSAHEAHSAAALFAFYRRCLVSWSSTEALTAWPRAPPNEWVLLEECLLPKASVLV